MHSIFNETMLLKKYLQNLAPRLLQGKRQYLTMFFVFSKNFNTK